MKKFWCDKCNVEVTDSPISIDVLVVKHNEIDSQYNWDLCDPCLNEVEKFIGKRNDYGVQIK